MEIKIESNLLYLRSLELDDLDRIYQWQNDPALYQTLVGTFRYVSRSALEEWLHNKIAYSSEEENLAICLTNNSQHIGNIYLRDICWVSRQATVHIFIGDCDQRGKGYGTLALCLLLNYAFKDLGLQRAYALILDDNITSIRMFEKCDFVQEGKLRKHAFKNGEFKDVIVMGICADDYFSSQDP